MICHVSADTIAWEESDILSHVSIIGMFAGFPRRILSLLMKSAERQNCFLFQFLRHSKFYSFCGSINEMYESFSSTYKPIFEASRIIAPTK